ncbi:hypothetical protein V7075_23205, partial [Neobacillus drentensis]|uniref:hypothetical protein n=1 Tax=Neobacillus drentensis TaxID=220684 RepID=UPI00300042A9
EIIKSFVLKIFPVVLSPFTMVYLLSDELSCVSRETFLLERTMWSVVFRLNTQRRLLYAGVFFIFL